MLNEKGMTLIELMVAMSILLSVLVVSVEFYKNYAIETNELGEFLTAKNLSIKAAEQVRSDFLENGKRNSKVVYQGIIRIEGVNYEVAVSQEDLTPYTSVYSTGVNMVRFTATTAWRNRETEVSVYVAAP